MKATNTFLKKENEWGVRLAEFSAGEVEEGKQLDVTVVNRKGETKDHRINPVLVREEFALARIVEATSEEAEE